MLVSNVCVQVLRAPLLSYQCVSNVSKHDKQVIVEKKQTYNELILDGEWFRVDFANGLLRC